MNCKRFNFASLPLGINRGGKSSFYIYKYDSPFFFALINVRNCLAKLMIYFQNFRLEVYFFKKCC